MTKKARTPIIEYEDAFAIELTGDQLPQERDRLTDQALIGMPGRVLAFASGGQPTRSSSWPRINLTNRCPRSVVPTLHQIPRYQPLCCATATRQWFRPSIKSSLWIASNGASVDDP
jgi:hypothetical protein